MWSFAKLGGHNALIPSVPYTDFEILNLTSQTVFIVFLGLLYDFGATPIPCFVDYFTVEPSRAKSHFTQSSLKDVCKYFSLIFNRFVTKLLLLTKATLLQWWWSIDDGEPCNENGGDENYQCDMVGLSISLCFFWISRKIFLWYSGFSLSYTLSVRAIWVLVEYIYFFSWRRETLRQSWQQGGR